MNDDVPPQQLDRRRFLGIMGAALAAAALPSSRADALTARDARIERIGLQLYTVRDAVARDMEGSLAKVAKVGYSEVEFAGYFGHTPRSIRAMLGRYGLRAPAAHIPIEDMEQRLPAVIEAAHTIGHEFLVCPWIPESRRSLDGYKSVAALFNKIGESARRAGLGFAYHNHTYEFTPTDGNIPYDLLLAATDPALVRMEMDIYWLVKSGRDPLAYFAKHPGRYVMVHVKDMDATPAHGMTDVGQGTIDFATIFAHRKQAGIQHYFVENDDAKVPFTDIQTSYTYLQKLRFA